ncbi:hypothetical protein PR048_013937 [Dryococelus australis]|uniref:Uncharacterized protein n=1 Tax=Dryococelus australis TaxID=614101 RepID=A0ABQ9HTM5_9NEOP|nr:hypothetical protein PR048_013937 [Dryococelus australis]
MGANAKKKHFSRAIIARKQRKPNSLILGNSNYDPHSNKPSMNPDMHQVQKQLLFMSLDKTDEERLEIERGTLLQAGRGEYLEHRCRMLTASKFGRICHRHLTTSCQSSVKIIVYSPDIIDIPSLSYGKKV